MFMHSVAVLARIAEPMSKENVLREQTNDEFSTKQSPGKYRGKKEVFLDDDDVLYRRKHDGKHQLVDLSTLIEAVIKEIHDPPYVSHPGYTRTHDLISYDTGGLA
jgi:hypothetical protein